MTTRHRETRRKSQGEHVEIPGQIDIFEALAEIEAEQRNGRS